MDLRWYKQWPASINEHRRCYFLNSSSFSWMFVCVCVCGNQIHTSQQTTLEFCWLNAHIWHNNIEIFDVHRGKRNKNELQCNSRVQRSKSPNPNKTRPSYSFELPHLLFGWAGHTPLFKAPSPLFCLCISLDPYESIVLIINAAVPYNVGRGTKCLSDDLFSTLLGERRITLSF